MRDDDTLIRRGVAPDWMVAFVAGLLVTALVVAMVALS